MKSCTILNLDKKLYVGKILFSVLFAALILLFSWQNLLRLPGVWLIQVTPLLVLLPGILKSYYRSYSWLCFVLLLYFVYAVLGVSSSAANFASWLYLSLVVSLFIVSMMCSRWQQYASKFLVQAE